jgi:hypothetical protein
MKPRKSETALVVPASKPRNTLVPLVMNRKAGRHEKTTKAIRKLLNQRKPDLE